MRNLAAVALIMGYMTLFSTVMAETGGGGLHFGSNVLGLTYLKSVGAGEVDTNLVMNSSDKTNYLSVAYLNQKQNLNVGERRVTIGMKIYAANNSDTNMSAVGVAIGGGLGHLIQGDIPVSLTAEAYYSPDMLSTGDSIGLVEYLARVGVEIAPNSKIYLGYNSINLELEDGGSSDLDGSFHVGVLLAF